MNFNKHSAIEGTHAFLGASTYRWLNYDDDKLATVYRNHLATLRGTELHDLAAKCIKLGQKLPKTAHTLNMYVNDAIGYKMTPEQPLFYSEFCFGTADSISFRNNFLRIHDLKTGVTPASMNQLRIYAALFCLEYGYEPSELEIELRIYQSDEIIIEKAETAVIKDVMETIKRFDIILTKIREEES